MKTRTKLAVFALAATAFADISGNATLSAGAGFAFDSGTNSASGDILFTGTAINFQGGAKGGLIPGATGASTYAALTPQLLQGLSAFASPSPIPASSLTPGSIVALQTKGGNIAKLLVNTISSTSFGFQYDTYGNTSGGGGTGGPTITDVQNNASLIPNGFPNSGVTPSSLIVIHGNGLAQQGAQAAPLQDSQKAGGLPTTLNGASVKITAGGRDYPVALYYAIPTQIAGVIPAAVPTGQATLTASFNGQASAAFNFTVVQSAFGIDVYNGNYAVVQDSVTGAIITPTNSAKPGEIVTTWGGGLGADPQDSDVSYTGAPHAINIPVKVYVGGVEATVAYAGGSPYPGVQIVVFTVPQGVPNGCNATLAILTNGAVLSNTPTFSVMDNGGVCSDAATGINGTQLSQFSGQGSVKTGSVIVGQSTTQSPDGSSSTNAVALASFQQTSGGSFTTGNVSAGSCTINETATTGSLPTVTGLDAGTVTVSGPNTNPLTLSTFTAVPGTYLAQLPSNAIPQTGGTFTFKGTGGSGATAVGPFTANVTFPNPLLSWTNQPASAVVNRTNGQIFTWTGGASGTYVTLSGSSTANGVTGIYTCIAPVSAGSFTVPTYILLALPVGTGYSSVQNSTNFSTFSATGLDYGFGIGFTATQINSKFQ